MESEQHRSYRTTSGGSAGGNSDLFICFTSRLSSSSMKISSKSILSPGRPREPPQISLSNSLSRRLRNSGSIKGGQASPMFPTGGKKRGCAFENPEPSSPKVTCIGQVRVKTKKQGKKMRTRSNRRGPEPSFRKSDQQNVNDHFQLQNSQQECLSHRNQRWVHLPMTICEGLRAFGAEFNCFLPCRSSCMASEREKEEKAARSENGSSCGAVLARWLVSLQDGEGKAREIELVVGEEEETESRSNSRRRQVFEGIEFKEEERSGNGQEEESRVSICIPPKNALLLMRCRSDPVKMAALANRFWESPARKVEDLEEEDDEVDEENENEDVEVDVRNAEIEIDAVAGEEEVQRVETEMELKHDEQMSEKWVSEDEKDGQPENEVNAVTVEEESDDEDNRDQNQEEDPEIDKLQEENPEEQEIGKEREDEEDAYMNHVALAEETVMLSELSVVEVLLPDLEKLEVEQSLSISEENEGVNEREQAKEYEEQGLGGGSDGDENLENPATSPSPPAQTEDEQEAGGEEESNVAETEAEAENEVDDASTESLEEEAKETCCSNNQEKTTFEGTAPEIPKIDAGEVGPDQSKKPESQPPRPVRESSVLPDCLLLMISEPKLSMEVSKETWICSTDFIKWLPARDKRRQVNKEKPKNIVRTDSNSGQCTDPLFQPPRSSCSFPIPVAHGDGVSMATLIEEKLVSAKGYEPFVLTRCKSEPMRSSAKLAPDACFWKNRKLEPHRPATLGVGTAGIGF